MTALTSEEQGLLAPVERAPILAHTLDWAAINSGTANLDGLAAMATRLADAFAVLPGEIRLVDPASVEQVDSQGRTREVIHGRHLVLSVRPEAERRVILTGHMDTVYPVDHPFQACDWLDENTLHGPGTADMKGGLAVMLAGLAVGFVVSLFQALTQIQDQTLPQVVKLVAVLLTIVFLGPVLAGQVAELGSQVLDNFPLWTR